MVDSMDLALGISGVQPAMPLVWQQAGHPSLPASAALCTLEAKVVGLCSLTRYTTQCDVHYCGQIALGKFALNCQLFEYVHHLNVEG